MPPRKRGKTGQASARPRPSVAGCIRRARRRRRSRRAGRTTAMWERTNRKRRGSVTSWALRSSGTVTDLPQLNGHVEAGQPVHVAQVRPEDFLDAAESVVEGVRVNAQSLRRLLAVL